MKRRDLTTWTLDELVGRFEEICIAQDQAIFDDKTAKFNRLYAKMDEVSEELCRRGPEARRALMRLYGHSNMQLRVQAAKSSYGAAPVEARACLQRVVDSRFMPQALHAGMSIAALDDGTSMLS
ncbi:MAG: DUF2019 domain-containing protein [Azospirillaceae bacterium]|nr:DUF2019 domain-containing protein [Azospirillaceae bacterium]